jgi:hypothetical protein
MGIEGYDGKCVIIKCTINGKDASGGPVYGLFMCVVDSEELLYEGEIFSSSPLDAEASLSEIYALLISPRPDIRVESLSKYEEELGRFIRTSRMFQNEKNLNDPKALEHKITYFCTSTLSLNSISFLEINEMTRGEIYLIIPSLKKNDESDGDDAPEEISLIVEDGKSGEGGLPDVVVACDPILDPVLGVAVGDLALGTIIRCKLREGSIFYSLMENASPDFDGTVTGDVTAVSVSELGSAVVALKLSEGVTGAMKLAGSVRVKIVSKPAPAVAPHKRPSVEIVLATAGVIVFLCILAALMRFLS